MELLTVTCERDIPDLILQIHSMEKFITEPCLHMVAVEDGSKTPDEWLDILAPLYNRHSLRFFWFERPDMDFSNEILRYSPTAKNGLGGLGWRRQQILKLQVTAESAVKDSVLVLDSKNIFVNPVDINAWPVKHGNGKYMTWEQITTSDNRGWITIKNWMQHLHDDYGLNIPEKVAMILETPFRWQTDIVKKIWNSYDIPEMFLNPEHMPNSEFHTYFYFVDPSDYDAETDAICRVMMWSPDENYTDYIQKGIDFCDVVNSPTHGLHRQTREEMPAQSLDIYEKWLTDKGLDATLVRNYMTWCR